MPFNVSISKRPSAESHSDQQQPQLPLITTINVVDDGLQDLNLPLPVQTFLWRQIAPFVRPKLGKLHEASCMELKEACKSFEKVLAQNIQFGLSPSLTGALESIPRWRILQAALPHLMHACSSLLHTRVKDMHTLAPTETKLLYTLHWIFLSAADECADSEPEAQKQPYLFSIPTITLFIYLFAPIVHHLKESDFQSNVRLENGIKFWHGMWEYRAPGAACFTAPVKPKARQSLNSISAASSAELFPAAGGRKQSAGQDFLHSPPSTFSETPKHDDDVSWVSSPKDCVFPETIPEEASSIEEERVVIFRLPPGHQGQDPSFYNLADASLLTQAVQPPSRTRFDFEKILEKTADKLKKEEPKPKTSSSTEKESLETDPKSPQVHHYDVNAATFLDVAVLRCLFNSHWQEEGVYWGLHYLNNRLREINEEATLPPSQPRRRSNSLPIPQIEVSLYQGPGNSDKGSPSNSSAQKDYMEVAEPPPPVFKSDDSPVGDSRRGSEKKKRVKMADLRTLIETRILSKSDRGLEKVGLEPNGNGKHLNKSEYHRSLDTNEHQLARSASLISREPTSNLIKGKSMPSLSCLLDTGFQRYVEPPRMMVRSTEKCQEQRPLLPRNPIITVTEHTPTPSPDYMRRQSFKGSFDSQLDVISTAGSLGFKSQMLRSHTDSHIAYGGIDEQEVPGSTFYITKEGGIDYEIILLAVYNVLKRDSNICSLRVLETGLNVCELLLELGAVKLGEHAHNLSMGIIRRALLHLGCPHGCNEGIRGPPAEFLRTQCHSMLSRLLRQLTSQSKKYLRNMVRTTVLPELVEFFHAFVGFCIDPSTLLSPLSGQGGYATNFGSGLSGSAESQVIAAVFRALVTRFVDASKEIKSPDNHELYANVRHLITYVKGAHGGTFRRVALSGVLAVCNRPHVKPPSKQTTRVIRHISQMDIQSYQSDDRNQRKCIFKKRSASSTCPPSFLETDLLEEHFLSRDSPGGIMKRKGVRPILTPRQSERQLLSDSTFSSERSQPPGRIGNIVRWLRGSKDRQSVDIESTAFTSDLTTSFSRKCSLSSMQVRGRVSQDGFGKSLERAGRQVKGKFSRFRIGKGKKLPRIDDSAGSCFSRRSSFDVADGPRDTEVVILKERYLIPTEPLRDGMLRFSFLLETCSPGTIPDPQLIAAMLDLPHAPVIARATVLVECSHFVHLCNRGQWPAWMKSASYRPSTINMSGNHRPSIASRDRNFHTRQRAAGKMFHQWAEALGHRLEELIDHDRGHFHRSSSNMHLNDPEKQKLLVQQDEEEDFLDDASVNLTGSECPPALKLVACIVLLEITSFLRETYQTIPKASRLSTKEKQGWVMEKDYREANRRWSMALSSMGHSQASAQSLQSIAGVDGPNERKISFVLHEPDNESEASSNTTITMQGEDRDGAQRRSVAPVRPFLLRRGTAVGSGGSFKRRSLKLKRGVNKDSRDVEPDYPVNRTDSVRSKQHRKVSSLSDRSDNSDMGQQSGGEESPGILSDDQPPESPLGDDSDDTSKNFPWIKAVVDVVNSFNFYCTHQNYCHPYCYRRHMRAATRMIKAIRKVYGEEFGLVPNAFATSTEQAKMSGRRERASRGGRKVSDQSASQNSPSKRKDSMGKKDKISLEDDGASSLLAQKRKEEEQEKKPKESAAILKYIKNQVRDLFHVPMALFLKSAAIMTEDQFVEVIPAAWELLLESDQEIATASAAVFILGSVKAPSCTTEIMTRALKNKDPNVRIGGILRYQVLWKSRFQVWSRMEDSAHMSFKVPPPGIEFTLPSPKIGIESLPVVDPPWSVQKSQSMEVTLDQERHRSLVTATKTRKKQQTEAIKHAIQLQVDKQRAERQSFMITTIAITQQAAHFPGIDHTAGEDHLEEEEGEGARSGIHLHAAHSLFPSCLCSAVMLIVASLDDAQVSNDGISVYEVAYQVIWTCLVEDSALFLRFILEKLTRDKQDQMFKLLRHLIRFVPRLPQQAAFNLYNYLIGYVMFYVRSSQENALQLVGAALSIIWMIVHSVHGIMFKDLKQILRKEQCDAAILLTANVPSAKKIVVHGPEDKDECGIPSQFPVQEDTQFLQLLRESLDFFGIEGNLQARHFLVDFKTHQILNPNWYVRDLYFFKRSQYPQLRLVEMSPEAAFAALQRQELLRKFVEIGKVHLTWAILKNVDMVVQRVVFLHEELMKLPSFPRKALEADLDLYQGGYLGKELLGLDVLHKFMWVRLIARMFEAMAGNFAYSADIQLFLNVLSGAALLHSEDSCIMRYVMATFINAAFNFKNIFSTSGYFMIMPTLLQIYSLHQTNKLVTTTIEYAVKQFYLMNRKPFILQMFGSVSSILDTDEEGIFGEAHKVQSSCLFNLLLSLETPSPDPLNIAELVKEPKPLKAIDFCYHDEDEMVGVMDCITLCVMTVSYSAESTRGYQMLVILEAILPCYLQQIQSTSYIPLEGKCERDIILQLAICVRTMVHNCEGLSKSYNGPYRSSPEHKGSSQRNCSRGPPCSPGLDFEEESHSKYVSDRMTKSMMESVEDSEQVRTEYRRPRDVLLSVVGDFLFRSTTRLVELSKKPGADNKPVDILDIKCHMRLADIAHSLLKVSPYDPESMGCRGLQRYMICVLPRADWGDEKMRQSLNKILLRLDKVFLKITKKPSIRRITNWEAASGLLKGIHETIVRYPFVLHWQQLKDLLSHLMNLIINEPGTTEAVSTAGAALMSQHPPPSFCSTVIRLVALQLVSPVESFSLRQICGGNAEFSSQEKAERYLLHLVMPLCLKICSGKGVSETGELKQADISFLVTVILNAMSPPAGRGANLPVNKAGADIRAGSLTFTGSRDAKRPAKISNSLYQAAFLALRVLCVSFESRLANEWPRIVRVMRDLGRRNEAAPELWSFLEFTVTSRTPLYLCLMPFVLHKINHPPIGDHERHMQFLIRERIRGVASGVVKSRGALLLDLARELRDLKDLLEERRYDRDVMGEPMKKDTTVTMPSSDAQKHQQRPSLISILTGQGPQTSGQPSTQLQDSRSGTGGHTPSDTISQSTINPPRESLSSSSNTTNKDLGVESLSTSGLTPTPSLPTSTTVIAGHAHPMGGSVPHLPHSSSLQQHARSHPPRLRFVQSVEFRHSSGERSTTPLSPESPADESSGCETQKPHRLQRSRAQSRKTFRIKRGHRDALVSSPQQSKEAPPAISSTTASTITLTPAPNTSPLSVATPPPLSKPVSDVSWDSVSQTSSTSGYRDNYSFQTGFLSPDCDKSGSQNSLLMLFEAQDEDTLI